MSGIGTSLINAIALPTLSGTAAGTAYTLTNTPAALTFGTTQPATVITTAGTWLITGFATLEYTAATFAAVRVVTLKWRRTNNTAADLTNGSVAFNTDIITTLTYTAGIIHLPSVFYTTANTDDSITIFGDVAVVPSAGTIDVSAAQIRMLRIA